MTKTVRLSELEEGELRDEDLEFERAPRGFLSRQGLADRYSVSLRTLGNMWHSRRLPRPIRLPLDGRPRIWWRLSELEKFERKQYGGTIPELTAHFIHGTKKGSRRSNAGTGKNSEFGGAR
jgi:hypothetical protein